MLRPSLPHNWVPVINFHKNRLWKNYFTNPKPSIRIFHKKKHKISQNAVCRTGVESEASAPQAKFCVYIRLACHPSQSSRCTLSLAKLKCSRRDIPEQNCRLWKISQHFSQNRMFIIRLMNSSQNFSQAILWKNGWLFSLRLLYSFVDHNIRQYYTYFVYFHCSSSSQHLISVSTTRTVATYLK